MRRCRILSKWSRVLFGTPDEPHVPQLADADASLVLDEGLIAMAAGPVGSDEDGNPRGLYREHCAHCHGVNGDGAGPTAAFLNPYPRDYRRGKFKFKSTPVGSKPTHDDLRKTSSTAFPARRCRRSGCCPISRSSRWWIT